MTDTISTEAGQNGFSATLVEHAVEEFFVGMTQDDFNELVKAQGNNGVIANWIANSAMYQRGQNADNGSDSDDFFNVNVGDDTTAGRW